MKDDDLLEKCYYIEGRRASGPRGDYYDYCYITPDGDFYAFGDEEGNYAGGIFAFEYAENDNPKYYGPFKEKNLYNYLNKAYIHDRAYYQKMKKYTLKKYRDLFTMIEGEI